MASGLSLFSKREHGQTRNRSPFPLLPFQLLKTQRLHPIRCTNTCPAKEGRVMHGKDERGPILDGCARIVGSCRSYGGPLPSRKMLNRPSKCTKLSPCTFLENHICQRIESSPSFCPSTADPVARSSYFRPSEMMALPRTSQMTFGFRSRSILLKDPSPQLPRVYACKLPHLSRARQLLDVPTRSLLGSRHFRSEADFRI